MKHHHILTEVNMDGVVGTTHHYAGLAFGNVASEINAGTVSNPKAAALQGFAKMQLLHERGLRQILMPPHPRPALWFLEALGFTGAEPEMIQTCAHYTPQMLSIAYSSSGMWAANAATVAPTPDTPDGKLHLTPANLISTTHRSLEPPFTTHYLKTIMADPVLFHHHEALPPTPMSADEGAANHMRLTIPGTGQGVHIFVYGKDGKGHHQTKYPARQHAQASYAIARMHGLNFETTFFIHQAAEAIDAGVFHDDVIATSNDHFLLYHEKAFADGDILADKLKALSPKFYITKVTASELTLQEAVATYLFNSQVLTLPHGGMLLLAPKECENHPKVRALIDKWLADSEHPITETCYVDVRQSMSNGGGPACLRLRLPMTDAQWDALPPGIKWSDTCHHTLKVWVDKYYRDRLTFDDLRDPQLMLEAKSALAELEILLGLNGLYDGYF